VTVSLLCLFDLFFVLVFYVGEWDCNDGSDEQRLFIMDRLSEHNSKLMDLTQLKQQCHETYGLDNTPFSNICDISSEYPCFRTGIDDPLNIKLHRPCINLTQIGDGISDCLTGLDERNRLQCSSYGMLGFHFQYNASLCVLYARLCDTLSSLQLRDNVAYETMCFHRRKVFKNGTVVDCNGLIDVMCLNGDCIKNARCNDITECPNGEDEYRCVSQKQIPLKYRGFKKAQFAALRLQNYPLSSTQFLQKNHSLLLIRDERNDLLDPTLNSDNHVTRVFAKRYSEVKTVYEIVHEELRNHYLPFICNRGLAVKYYTGHTVCFCSPSFYGLQCEFYSDRTTVLTHLHLDDHHPSFNQINMIKILATFLSEEEIIDYYEFHVDPQIQLDHNYMKQQIYFVYPRLKTFLPIKRANRSGTQLYNVRFEAFNLHLNETIQIIGVWKYSIYFDYLPSFRLSKILRFQPQFSPMVNDPCFNNSCGENGRCQKIINSNDYLYFCFCKTGYYGLSCQHYDEQCDNYCSPESICKPKYRGILTGNQQNPFCLCPISTFGNGCYFKNVNCQQNPCLNGGTCIEIYDLTDINNYLCICTNLFEGNHCQVPKGMVNITFKMSSNFTIQASNVVAATVLYSDYDDQSLRLIVRHQQVYVGLPSNLKLTYSGELGTYAPTTAVLKVYGSDYRSEEPKYYLLYFYPDQREMNITVDLTSENSCPLVDKLWDLLQTNDTPGKLRCGVKLRVHMLS
jgi:hypothetical protein